MNNIIYTANINLIHPIKDVEKANEYLQEENMFKQYFMREYPKLSQKIKSITWYLYNEYHGQIEIVLNTFSVDIDESEKETILNWVKVQTFDGLGEGFEQRFNTVWSNLSCTILEKVNESNMNRKEKINLINSEHLPDLLLTDSSAEIRAAIAKKGYAQSKFINDESWFVRAIVASNRYGLDKLINDSDFYVRAEVAKQGYGLEYLLNDPNENVRVAAAETLLEKIKTNRR